MIQGGQSPEAMAMVSRLLGATYDPQAVRCISAVSDLGELLGVVMLSRFMPHSCEISVAADSPKFLSRRFIREVANYVFGTLGLWRLYCVAAPENERSVSLIERLGFVRETDILQGWFGPGRDGVMFRMLRTECKWIG